MYLDNISISFIVFTYNSSDMIIRCLSHIKEALEYFPVNNEIILVDNNSTDNTIELVNNFSIEEKFELKILNNPRQGLSYSRVMGVKVASKEFVCFIDDDNFILKNWIEVLASIVYEKNPDVIGCRTIGISETPFPRWWNKYQGYYACGSRFSNTGFLSNPLDKMWGAGLVVRTNFLRAALLEMDLLCTGRLGGSQMSGDDVELNYRLRLLGAQFYHSLDLVLNHFMRSHRLTTEHLHKTRVGNAVGAIYIDIYKYPITKRVQYKLLSIAMIVFLGSPVLTIKYKVNYFIYGVLRFKTLYKRYKIQRKIKRVFTPLLMEKYDEQ